MLKNLLHNPTLLLFLILGFGVLAGKLRIAGVQLGSVTGVLLVGLLAGHFGYSLGGASQSIGFILFIYCVGVQAGPGFLSAFKQDGLKYAGLAVTVAITGAGLAWTLSDYLGFDFGIAAGILGGALTSTPTLVAAQDAIQQGAAIPDGLTAAEAVGNMTSAYAITYVFGMAGLILVISFLPRTLGIDVAAEAQDYGRSRNLARAGGLADLVLQREQPTARAYRVERDDAIGRSERTEEERQLPAAVQRIKRGEVLLAPTPDFVLERGDIVSVIGLESAHAWARENLGPEALDDDVIDRTGTSRRILVAKKAMAGRALAELDFYRAEGCFLTEIIRSGVALPRRLDLQLHLGDVLAVTGPPHILDQLAADMGYEEKRLQETDLVTVTLGIGLGVAIGSFAMMVGEVSVGLGLAGGVLVAGLLMGTLHARRPDLGNLPTGARNVLMELGLLFFMAGVAVNAGSSIVETFLQWGWRLALTGMLVTLVPVAVTWLLGRLIFRMNSALLLGAITGAMTSTAALNQVQAQARSQVPMLGYVGAYTFANVLLAFAGALIVRF